MKEWNTSRTVISTRFKRQKGAIWLFAMRCTLVEWIMARWPFYPRDAYALARSLLSSCVWMSVCHMPVLCLNGWTCLKIFRPSGRPVILVFDPLRRYTIARGTPSTGVLNTRGGKNLRLSTEFAVYLGNGACEVGCRLLRYNTCRFRWPWVTFDPDIKVMTFFRSRIAF